MNAKQISTAQSAGKMQSIEAARAVAAVSVLLMHAANLMRVEHLSGHVGLGGIFDFGYVGVDFFFVLSGFIITYVHFFDIGRPGRLPRYLWRRFSRIYPIYWFLLVVAMLLTGLGRVASGKGFGFEIGPQDILGTVFLVMDYDEPKYIGVAWTLQFEVMFYLMFSVLLLHARVGAALLIAWAIFLLCTVFGWINVPLPAKLDNAHCIQFLFGIAVGVLARRRGLRLPAWSFPLIALAFVSAVGFEVYGPWGAHSQPGRLLLGLAAAAVLAALVSLENENKVRVPRWLAFAGSVSYSIYLGHILFVSVTYVVLLKTGLYHRLPELAVFLIAVGVALFATCLVGRLVELPLVSALKDGFGGSARPRLGAMAGKMDA